MSEIMPKDLFLLWSKWRSSNK